MEGQIDNRIGIIPYQKGALAVFIIDSGILQLGICADIAAEAVNQCDSSIIVIAGGQTLSIGKDHFHFFIQAVILCCHGLRGGNACGCLRILLLRTADNGTNDESYDQNSRYTQNNEGQRIFLEQLLLGLTAPLRTLTGCWRCGFLFWCGILRGSGFDISFIHIS